MNPMHVTITVVLAAVAAGCVVAEVVACVLLLRGKKEPPIRPLLLGLAAAIGAHLSVYGLTGRAWGAAFCVVPLAAVVVMCTPRTWQPPPRRARLARAPGSRAAAPSIPGMADGDQVGWTSTAGEISVRSVTEDDQAPLSAKEQQAWESIRRSLGDS
jgi:hypothetical protein